jgi:hypothetical protein
MRPGNQFGAIATAIEITAVDSFQGNIAQRIADTIRLCSPELSKGDINLAVVTLLFMPFNLAMANQVDSCSLHHRSLTSEPAIR